MTAGLRTRRGPYDSDELDPDQPAGLDRADFGALHLPVPAGAVVEVPQSAQGRLQAVHLMLPQGRLSVSALAVPTTGRLWPELAKEIHTSLRAGGARVRWFDGRWGRELRARTGEAFSVFVGIDGPRWMVYGVATGPVDGVRELDRELRQVLAETVVVRGIAPYPVRTVLPLTLPEDLQAEQDARRAREAAAAETLTAQAEAANTRTQARDDADAPDRAEAGLAEPERAEALAPLPAPAEPPTEEFPLVPVVLPADRSAPPPGEPAHEPPHEPPTAEFPAVPPGSGAPAMALLLGDPMELFRASPPGRHRRS